MVPPRVFMQVCSWFRLAVVQGPEGFFHRPHEGAAEGIGDLLHKGCVCWVDRCGGLRRPLALGDGLQLLPAVHVEPPCRGPVLGVRPAALRPPPEAVEGMAWVPGAGFPRHDGRQGVWQLVVGRGVGAVWQGCARQAHGVEGFQAPVALLRVRGDPHLVVVATSNRIIAMVLGSLSRHRGPTRAVSAPGRHRSNMVLRLRPLSRAVLLSRSARSLYGGILRVLLLGCGAARSWPPVMHAGLGSVGGAMSVCAQPRCLTHTLPWSNWFALNHQIHTSTRSSAICIPEVTSAWSCRTKMSVVAACGRGRCVVVDAVDRPEFRVVKGVCVPPWWSGLVWGVGGAWSPGLGRLWCRSGRCALGWCQGVPQGHSPWRAPVAGASNRKRRWAVSHRISEGCRCLSFLRPLLGPPRRAPVVGVRPPRPGGFAVLQLGWGTPWCTGPVGWVAGARVEDRCRRALLAGGALRGLSPHPPFGPLVGRGAPWPCVRGVLSTRQRAGR